MLIPSHFENCRKILLANQSVHQSLRSLQGAGGTGRKPLRSGRSPWDSAVTGFTWSTSLKTSSSMKYHRISTGSPCVADPCELAYPARPLGDQSCAHWLRNWPSSTPSNSATKKTFLPGTVVISWMFDSSSFFFSRNFCSLLFVTFSRNCLLRCPKGLPKLNQK